MNDLLGFVLDAHGGLRRWSGVSTLTAKLAAGGPFSRWDALQAGYFLSYAMWNYLTTPFLLTYPGSRARESTHLPRYLPSGR